MPESPQTHDQRRRLERWLSAVGLLVVAEDLARADVTATNSTSALAAHAAIETCLGVLIGPLADTRADQPFDQLLSGAVQAAGEAGVAISRQLQDDLRTVHRTRNAIVHSASVIHHDEVERAIGSGRTLLDLLAVGRGTEPDRPLGLLSAIADLIQLEAVAIWLRHAEDMILKGHSGLAADGLTRALDEAIQRTKPRLEAAPSHASQARADALRFKPALGQMSLRAPPDNTPLAIAVDQLAAWVLPLALGVPPATHGRLRSIIGFEEHVDIGGYPLPVGRSEPDPDEGDLRWAASQTGLMVFRLWSTGALMPNRGDDEIVRLAQPFLADPLGVGPGVLRRDPPTNP